MQLRPGDDAGRAVARGGAGQCNLKPGDDVGSGDGLKIRLRDGNSDAAARVVLDG